MTRDALDDAFVELDAERRTMLAEVDALDAALDAIEAQYRFHQAIADVRVDAIELRARLLAMGDGVTVVH